MAKYDNTKFYWLQLKEDFFEEDAINWLEEQPNGKEYCLFYLKLCLKSLKTNGVLIRKVGEMLVPYDCKKLGEITNTDVDTVVVAMQLLKQIGLIKMLENGELFITELEKMIGFQSIGAFKKQQQRIIRGQKVDNCPPEIELEKELEIENKKEIIIKKEKNKTAEEEKHKYGEYKHVLLTDKQYEKLVNDFGKENATNLIKKLDESIEMKGYKYKNHNLVLRGWVLDNLKKSSLWKEVKKDVVINVDTSEQDKTTADLIDNDPKAKAEFEAFMRSRSFGNILKEF